MGGREGGGGFDLSHRKRKPTTQARPLAYKIFGSDIKDEAALPVPV